MENKDYDIILIEDYPCKSKDQLFARECYYTNTIECVNIRKNQGRLLELGKKEYNKEYRNENVETIKIKNKQYYKENSDTIKAKVKEYYEKNIDTIKDYVKEYQRHNVDSIKAKKKEYHETNINEIKAKNNEKFSCSCGGKYTHANRLRHMNSIKHQKYLSRRTNRRIIIILL